MNNCVEVYNIFARAVKFLDQFSGIEKFFIKDDNWSENLKSEIIGFVPQLYNSSNEVEYLEIGIIKRTDFIIRLDACVRNYIDNNEGFKLMRLLQIDDEAMRYVCLRQLLI